MLGLAEIDKTFKIVYNTYVNSAIPAIRIRITGLPRTFVYSARGDMAESVPRRLRLVPFVLAAVFCALLAFFSVMTELRTDPELAEWWTQNVAQGVVRVIGALTSFLPISVFEILVIVVVACALFLFVRLVINLCRAQFRKIFMGLLAAGVAAMYVLDMYMLSMGFGYYRAAMPKYLAGDDYNSKQATAVADFVLADYNALAEKFKRDKNGCVVCPYTFGELAELMRKEYARLDDDYFFSYTPKAKPVVNGWFMSASLITGVTFLPTGEANVNTAAPPTTITYTMAHELAHAKGVMREGDANLISYYVLLSSKNDYLRYCGYVATFYDFVDCVQLAGDSESFSRIIASVSPLIDGELAYTYDYWRSQPDIMGEISEFFNNWYLESNGVENGTGSYDDGNQSGTVTPIDPDTNKPIIDPDTNKPVVKPVYSEVQKTYFRIYESKFGTPSAE